MKIKEKLFGTFIALTLLGASFTMQAATIWLEPPTEGVVGNGNAVTLDLWMDFTGDATLGGGTDLFFDDTSLSYVSFVINPDLGSDPSFTRVPDYLPDVYGSGVLNGLAFGNFAGLSGPSLVGVFTFDTIAAGTTDLTMAVNDFPAGPFMSAITYAEQTVTFTGASVTVSPSAVPLPAAAWLMLSGLGAVFGFCKRKSNVASV